MPGSAYLYRHAAPLLQLADIGEIPAERIDFIVRVMPALKLSTFRMLGEHHQILFYLNLLHILDNADAGTFQLHRITLMQAHDEFAAELFALP